MSIIGLLLETLIAMLPALIIGLVSGVVGLVFYVLMSWGMYAIAKRRGISKPWLAWLPYGNNWILGAIADHYNLMAKGKQTSKRKVLLGLSIGVLIPTAIIMVAYVVLIMVALGQGTTPVGSSAEATAGLVLILLLLVMVLVLLVELAIALAYSVVMYIALFDLFRSCNPDTSVVFLVLSIVLGFNALFVFLDRNKDLGMPAVEDGFAAPAPEQLAE